MVPSFRLVAMPGVAFFASQNLWRRCGRTHTHTRARAQSSVDCASRRVPEGVVRASWIATTRGSCKKTAC